MKLIIISASGRTELAVEQSNSETANIIAGVGDTSRGN
jgi:hypothetical protein